MTTVNKAMLKAVRADLDAALAEVAKKHGLQTFKSGNCTFDPTAGSFNFKVEGTVEGGIGKEGARLQFEATYDPALPKVGESFFFGTHTYSAIGMNTTGSKVVVKRNDGKTFLIKTDAAKVAVSKSRQAVAS